MTAICGIWHPQGADESAAGMALAMLDRLRHRGTCEHHLFRDAVVTLGQGWGPRGGRIAGKRQEQDANGSFAAIDGSILNASELIHELKGKGHQFRSGDPTEVLLRGYREWGEELVDRLRGPFAFALWDAQGERLLLGRDRLGIKPLYLYADRTSQRVVFASEIKALFADPAVPRSIDPGRFAEYLTFRSVAGARTLFEEIRALAPGQLAGYRRDGMVSRPLGTAEPAPVTRSGSVVEEGAALLENAVRLHLEEGRKIGTVLSGGLDSSLVSAIAARHFRGPPLETLCAGFDDPRYDERPIAREVARQIGTRHHEIVVRPEEIEAWIEPLTWINDEPLTHPNAVPMYLLCREARERFQLDLLLSGEGADEVFGGYGWYTAALWRQRTRWLGGSIHALAAIPMPKLRTLQRVLAPDYLLFANALNSGGTGDLLDLTEDALGERRESWDHRLPERDALFRYDQRTYLLPLLQRQDRMSRAAGLDTHVPFLDLPLVDWANRLPARVKLPRGRRKGLLKEIARRWLPEAIISRPKVGFAMPLGEWMRPGGAFEARVERLRDAGSAMTGLIDHGRLDEAIRKHSRGVDHTDLLWALIAFDAWRSSCVEGSHVPAISSPPPPGPPSLTVGPGISG